jgi:hypothetical protein
VTELQRTAPGKSAEKAKSSAAGNNSILNKPLSYVWLRAQQITQKIRESICDAAVKFVIFKEEHDTEIKLIGNVILIAALAVTTVLTGRSCSPISRRGCGRDCRRRYHWWNIFVSYGRRLGGRRY